MIEDFKYLYHLFARGRATSKHGGGGRYNAILQFKGGANKKNMRKKKKKKKKRKKEKGRKKYMYEKKKKI
jgi:hypothetical protein